MVACVSHTLSTPTRRCRPTLLAGELLRGGRACSRSLPRRALLFFVGKQRAPCPACVSDDTQPLRTHRRESPLLRGRSDFTMWRLALTFGRPAARSPPPRRRRAHWAADGTLLLVGAGNKTTMQLTVNMASAARGAAVDRGVRGQSSFLHPFEDSGERAFNIEHTSSAEGARALPQPDLLTLNHGERWRGALSGGAQPSCLALVASPNGRFAVSVLDNLRLVLWDNASGASWLLTPPMSGGTQLAGNVDVSVSVASDGCTIALRVLFLRADRSAGLRALASTPLWLFIATSAPDAPGGDTSARPACLEGSWVMVPVPGSQEEDAGAGGLAYPTALLVAARYCEAVPLSPAGSGDALKTRQQWGAAGEEARVHGAGDWMLSTWSIACPPAPSSFTVAHSIVLDALGIASTKDAPHSPASVRPLPQACRADVVSACGAHAGASGPASPMAEATVMLRCMRIRTLGMAHAHGMVLHEDRCCRAVWELQLRLPLKTMRGFEARCRQWMDAKLTPDSVTTHAEVHRPGWRQRMSFSCCKRVNRDDASEHSCASASSRDSAARQRQGPAGPCAERTGPGAVSVFRVCWDQQGVRAGVVVNIAEHESLVAVLDATGGGRRWRRGGGGTGGEKGGVGGKGVASGALVMERYVLLSDVLEGGRRDAADMTWDARGMLLIVLTVDHRVMMFSRDGLPSRVLSCQAQHPGNVRPLFERRCPGERGGDDRSGHEHRMSYERDRSRESSARGSRVPDETSSGSNVARWLHDSSDELLPYQLLPFSGQQQQDHAQARRQSHESSIMSDMLYRALSADSGIHRKRSSEMSTAGAGDRHVPVAQPSESACLDLSSFICDRVVAPGD